MSKKILIFSLNYYPKYVGGAEVAIKEIVQRVLTGQEKDNYEFHMITLRFDSDLPRYELLHGIHIHRIGFTKKNASIADLKNTWLKYNKYYFQFFAFVHAINLHRKLRFDAIWAMMAHSCGVPAAMFKTFFPNVKYILTLQEGDPTENIEALAKPFPKYLFFLNHLTFILFKRAFTKADIVQSISTFLNSWAEKMGNSNLKVVIPNAVDVKQFTREITQDEIDKVKDILGKKEDETWLITTSRLVHKNGVDDVIKALKLLQEKGLKRFHFAILGIGPEEDKYKSLVAEYGLESSVKFLGEVKHPEMAVYLQACDIFIRPSRSEGMGNSFVEAMSMRLPVIATTEGGLSDFIFDEKTAWVVEKNNPENIADVILKIDNLKNSNLEKYTQILNEAYDMVLEKYDWDIIGSRMEKEVFEKI